MNTQARLLRIIEKRKKRINQPIYVRDIHICQPQALSLGEAETTKDKGKFLERLIQHIDALAKITNVYHLNYNCEKNEAGEFVIKDDCKNKVTRLLTSEFAFYTQKPMNEEEFNLLIQAIEVIAKNQKENCHLLLSSFALLNADNEVMNVCLYVQCGKNPIINPFCKANPHEDDFNYEGKYKLFQRTDREKIDRPAHHYISAAHRQSQSKQSMISTNSVFSFETAGGAQATIAGSICYDLTYSHSKKLIQDATHVASHHEHRALLPEHGDHLVTSNSITVTKEKRVTKVVTQVDPDSSNLTKNQAEDGVNLEELSCIQPGIKKAKNSREHHFVVEKPPFGNRYFIAVKEEKQLGGYVGALRKRLEYYNCQVTRDFQNRKEFEKKEIQRQDDDYRKARLFNTVINTSTEHPLAKDITTLFTILLEKCAPTWFDSWFNRQKMSLKLAARVIILDAQKTFLTMKDNSPALILHADVLLRDLILRLSLIQPTADNALINHLLAEVKRVKDQLPKSPAPKLHTNLFQLD